MKAYIAHSVVLKDKDIAEAKALLPKCEFVFIKTDKTIQPAWNPYFQQMWGDFKWILSLMPAVKYNKGDIRCYITSDTDLRAKSITAHLGMYDMTDMDGVLDFYFGMPKALDPRAKLNGFKSNFAWGVIHEALHGKEQNAGFKDAVHAMEEQGRLKEMLTKHLERDELETKVGLLQHILELTKILFSLKKKPRVVTDLLPLVKRQSDKIVAAMSLLGLPVRVVEGYRSPERQTELYNQGRTIKGNIVTNAKAGESWHGYGMAVDIIFRKQGYNATEAQWKILADVAVANGFEWGGSDKWKRAGFVDKPHFQMTLGYSLKDFQNGKIDYTKFN